VEEGTAYLIPSDERHSVRVLGLEKGGVFSPPREDYLRRQPP